jgi:PAS domain S-box-containing protein
MEHDYLQDSVQFNVVTETMVDGLIVIDSTGVIRYVNPACERLFEYDDGVLLGRNVSTLMPSPFAEAHDGYLARHREKKVKGIVGVGRELKGLKSDRTIFPMYLSVGEAVISGETRFIGIIYDLTEKKRAEDLILHHQKLDAIGQLSGGIAHDFNNLLSIIGGNLEIAASQDQSPPAHRALVRAQEAVQRASRITQRLLSFARRGSLSNEPIDINEALSNLSDMLRRSLGETIEISMQLEAEPAIVDVDIDQLETAVLNLAINSKDAMPQGGRIVIETENARVVENPRTIQEVPAGDYVRVSVSDNGNGMPPEICQRAMEPFFTTKDVGKGTGLGLSMIYGFLKQLGGHARIYSEVGRGTRVSMFFPRSRHAAEHPQDRKDAAAPRGCGETILVVEDDADVRLVTVSRLESLGYQVRVAADAKGALEIVRTHPDIDLGLLDVVMPGGMDGHELADEIEKIKPGMRLVLMSGYSAKIAAGLHDPNARPFLSKPVSLAKLARVLRKVLDVDPA